MANYQFDLEFLELIIYLNSSLQFSKQLT